MQTVEQPILLSEEMFTRAKEERAKRDPYIEHHFEVQHFTGAERDIVGFLGEFACCESLGIDWHKNIRDNYLTADRGDINKGVVLDVKTETIPRKYFDPVFKHTVDDDRPYGRRLIARSQASLIPHYDYIVFGGIVREDLSQWCPFGFLDTETILREYKPVGIAPFGARYPEPALAIRTSELRPISELRELLNRKAA